MPGDKGQEWFNNLDKLPIWIHFTKIANIDQRKIVVDLVKYAAPILAGYVDTFPTYTLHNHIHAENIVKLMSDILGPRVNDLTVLDSAMLVLSAYFHDIGMVYDKDNLQTVADETEFEDFLQKNPDAYIKVKKTNTIPKDIVAWYCRWRHADRVFFYLNKIKASMFEWGAAPIKDTLGNLCRSHALNIVALKDTDTYPNDFLDECDIPFCALILRLADILDFDRSRTPESVYELLKLDETKDPAKQASETEWKKHLCSGGFQFSRAKREPNYTIGFVAGPKEPAIEYDVRCFLDVIENEFSGCTQLLQECSDQWRSFSFPARIKRSNIISDGYKYGEHRFSLDQQHVLNLFMGDNLYDDPYIFVRELLQNAIDTTRYRAYYEENSGNQVFNPEPINITNWYDNDGCQWVRIDDYGMGMNENIILKFMLSVGKSYYKSSEFEAEKLHYSRGNCKNFTPISRFGIGLLSCFISCDRLEISTWHVPVDAQKNVPLRLSLPGLYGFYKLQTDKHVPTPMPSQTGIENGYRKKHGTSIAARINPTQERGNFDLAVRLERLLLCPSVPVHFDGKSVGVDLSKLVDRPWLEPKVFTLSQEQCKEIGNVLDMQLEKPIEIHLIPLDLTKNSLSDEIKGQIVIAVADIQEKVPVIIDRYNNYPEEVYPYETYKKSIILDNRAQLRFKASCRSNISNKENKECDIIICDLSTLIPKQVLNSFIHISSSSDLSWLSHNGIAVPLYYRDIDNYEVDGFGRGSLLELAIKDINSTKGFIVGLLALYDSLRPDLSISRDALKALPWRLRSLVNLAVGYALREYDRIILPRDCVSIFEESIGLEKQLLYGELLKLADLDLDFWKYEPLILANDKVLSIDSILHMLDQCVEVTLSKDSICNLNEWYKKTYQLSFTKVLRCLLIQHYLDIEVIVKEGSNCEIKVIKTNTTETTGHLKHFPPLFFARYADPEILCIANMCINMHHPFASWLISVAPALHNKLPGVLDTVRRSISSIFSYGKDNTALISTINTLLDRVRNTKDPEIAPPSWLKIYDKDII